VSAGELVTSIFLIGDAGKAAPDDAVLLELERQARGAPRASAIVYLGDNVYPRGLPEVTAADRPEMERRLLRQIEVATRSGISAYFLPGNHDWWRMGREGWDAVRRSEIFIRSRGEGLARQAPRYGCPGPEIADAGPVRLVLLDTQWWLQREDFPRASDSVSTCVEYSEELVVRQLARVLEESQGRHVVVAGHNPLATRSEHGGYFSLKTHLFPLTALKRGLWIPLPLLGSLYPLARANGLFAYNQDLNSMANRHMRAQLGRAMAAHPPLLYAAGHDHNLQVFRGPVARYTVVSGNGMMHHSAGVGWASNTIFASDRPGFLRMDVDRRGRVRLAATVIERQGPRDVLGIWLVEP
jgi:hypothetical protein